MRKSLPLTTRTPEGFLRCRAVRGTTVAHLRAQAGTTLCGLAAARTSGRPSRACGDCWYAASAALQKAEGAQG
jgi:hypothetical protein